MSEAGSYSKLIDFVYHSTLGLRLIKKRKDTVIAKPATLDVTPACSRAHEFGTNKAVMARFWPWLEPFLRQKSLKRFELFYVRSDVEIP